MASYQSDRRRRKTVEIEFVVAQTSSALANVKAVDRSDLYGSCCWRGTRILKE